MNEKTNNGDEKREELGITNKIEVDWCLGLAVYKNMYRKADHTIYKEHNYN